MQPHHPAPLEGLEASTPNPPEQQESPWGGGNFIPRGQPACTPLSPDTARRENRGGNPSRSPATGVGVPKARRCPQQAWTGSGTLASRAAASSKAAPFHLPPSHRPPPGPHRARRWRRRHLSPRPVSALTDAHRSPSYSPAAAHAFSVTAPHVAPLRRH